MEKQLSPHLKLELGFQYLGPEHGSVPHLDLEMISGDGTQYDCDDYVFAHSRGEISDEEFKKVIEFSRDLEKYSKGYIKVGHVGIGSEDYVSRIMTDFRGFEHESYSDMIATFSKCVADIYYDYNGRKVGFTVDDKSKLPVEIQIDKKIINVPNPIDTKEARSALASNIGKTIGYIIAEYNANKVNGISQHQSPRR